MRRATIVGVTELKEGDRVIYREKYAIVHSIDNNWYGGSEVTLRFIFRFPFETRGTTEPVRSAQVSLYKDGVIARLDLPNARRQQRKRLRRVADAAKRAREERKARVKANIERKKKEKK